MKVKHYIAGFFSVILMFAAHFMAFGAPQKIHRVHPPQSSPQYKAESARVQLDVISSRLGLDENKKQQLKKASDNHLKKQNKLEEKEKKLTSGYNLEMKKVHEQENQLKLDYENSVKDILGAEQYEQYLKLLCEMGLRDPENEKCYQKLEQEEIPNREGSDDSESQGGIGPIIKAPDPVIMYGE